jgi:hypothetical protein
LSWSSRSSPWSPSRRLPRCPRLCAESAQPLFMHLSSPRTHNYLHPSHSPSCAISIVNIINNQHTQTHTLTTTTTQVGLTPFRACQGSGRPSGCRSGGTRPRLRPLKACARAA